VVEDTAFAGARNPGGCPAQRSASHIRL
jgi:hypothetical protein